MTGDKGRRSAWGDTDRASAVDASIRARALRQVSSLTFRPLVDRIPVTPRTIRAARLAIDRILSTVAPILRDTTVEHVRYGRVRGEWVRGPKADRDDAVILYVHGGGFVAGSPRAYRGITSRLSTATRLPVFAVEYRRAPEHPYPAAPHDISAAYRALLAHGHRPDRIVLAGDSAGGYLAADFAIRNACEGQPCPAALLLFCPMTDLSLTTVAEYETAGRDGLLPLSAVTAAIGHFTSEPYELLPRRGTSLPPTLIHASDAEFFAGDAITLANRLRAAGTTCELVFWQGQMHVFHVLAALVPEARTAYRDAGRFVRAQLNAVTFPPDATTPPESAVAQIRPKDAS